MNKDLALETSAIVGNYNNMELDRIAALEEADRERHKRKRWFRRPAFWIPVACLTFTVGLFVEVGR